VKILCDSVFSPLDHQPQSLGLLDDSDVPHPTRKSIIPRKPNRLITTIVCLIFVSVGPLSIDRLDAQTAANTAGDLWAENRGDAILLWWVNQSGTSEYIMYRSTSSSGPWQWLGGVDEVAARTGGAKLDETPDAALMDLCYKVEALDASSKVIRTYQPMCIPKFVQ
jgi:hypothetical protein